MTRLIPDRLQRREICDARIMVSAERELSIEVGGFVSYFQLENKTERNQLCENYELKVVDISSVCE